jgi:hypothetical protein
LCNKAPSPRQKGANFLFRPNDLVQFQWLNHRVHHPMLLSKFGKLQTEMRGFPL